MAEVSSPGLLNLEKELVCFICTEVLYQPLTLIDCLHTFCGSCLKEWFFYQHKKATQSKSSSTTNPYTCPTCRATVKDARHNATVSTLLDMFLAANPDRGKTTEEKEDMAKVYTPGDDIIPKTEERRRHRTRRAEEAAEEVDRRQVEEARERSLRDLRDRDAEQSTAHLAAPNPTHVGNRSRSRESRGGSRERQTRRARELERNERRRRAEAEEAEQARLVMASTASSSSLSPPTLPPRHPSSVEARQSQRQVVHQASLRSIMSGSESGTGTGDSLSEARILQEILSEGLLDGIDLNSLDAIQEDELSERIAAAYRQRHQSRSGGSLQQPAQNATLETTPAMSTITPPRPEPSATRPREHRARSSQGRETTDSRPSTANNDSRHPPVSRPHLLPSTENLSPLIESTAHRRRASDQGRRRTSPNSQSSRAATDPATQASRSTTDLSSPPQEQGIPRHDRVVQLSGARRTSTEPMPSVSMSEIWRQRGIDGETVQGSPIETVAIPSAANERLESEATTGAAPRRHAHTASELPTRSSVDAGRAADQDHIQASPRVGVIVPTRSTTRFIEPSISCGRCSRPGVQYELYKHCHRCNMDICLSCYRGARGCNHWFGFGHAAQSKFEATHPQNRSSQLIEFPHVLVGRKYLPPPPRSIIEDSSAPPLVVTTISDPESRLQEGKFCDRCSSFANACFWSCDYCNEGEWGFCNDCVNTHHCCTHPLLPISHKSFAPPSPTSQRPPGYDPSTGSITLTPTQLHASIVPDRPYHPSTPQLTLPDGSTSDQSYLPLSFTTNCDICTHPIPPSEARFHCPSHLTPSHQQSSAQGDYDICTSCYLSLVKSGRISRADGPAGWRKCPTGHRMIVTSFDDEDDAGSHRRIIVSDLVGGHKFTADDIAAFNTTNQPETLPSAGGRWTWNDDPSGTRRVSRTRALTADRSQASKFPPDGGYGKKCLALWSYWPEAGEAGKGELSFPKGAEVAEVEEANEDWMYGVYAGDCGLLPAQYVRVMG